MNKIIFHPRDYTLLGITGVMNSMLSQDFVDAYGDRFAVFVSYLLDGRFFMGMEEYDRKKVSLSYLQHKMDVKQFDTILEKATQLADEYLAHIEKPVEELTVADIFTFYNYYHQLIMLVYPSMDAIDFIDILSDEKQTKFKIFSEQLRHIAEMLYKKGEEEFVPNKAAKILARDYGLDEKAAMNITCHELSNFVQKGVALPEQKELLDRRNSFLYIMDECDKAAAFSGAKAREKAQEIGYGQEEIKNVSEVTGNVAYRGKVSGEVVIILSKQDLHKAKDGCILVSSMTQPSFLPAMKKAAAFVTDEGGLLCHAAIVAREMKKPCVIGTKIATRVFQDGDEVEVDAESGVVKKINN